MTRILVFSAPLYGHINPILAVIEQLISRGAEVAFYAPENFEQAIRATGATFKTYHSTFMPPGTPCRIKLADGRHMALPTTLPLTILLETGRVLPQILDEARAWQPDSILYDSFCLWGRMIAQILDLPAITSMAYILTPHLLAHPALSPQLSRSIEAQSKAGLIIQSMYRKLCETYRQPPLDTLDYLCHTEPLNIVFMPRAFHPAAEQFDERFAFVGASFNPQRDANLTPSVHDLLSGFPPDKADRPLLYISLGTLYNQRPDFFRQCLRAFGSEDLRVILSLGEGLRREELGPLPANIQVASYVPQLEVLQRASAFITHGGANSVMEAFSFGVPVIVVPQNDEQTLTATRVVELGLGCALESANLSESVLRTAVSQVQQPAIRATVSQMQTAVQTAGGPSRAAEIILQHSTAP